MIAITAWRAGSSVAGPVACFVVGAAVAPLAVALWLALAGALPAWARDRLRLSGPALLAARTRGA